MGAAVTDRKRLLSALQGGVENLNSNVLLEFEKFIEPLTGQLCRTLPANNQKYTSLVLPFALHSLTFFFFSGVLLQSLGK